MKELTEEHKEYLCGLLKDSDNVNLSRSKRNSYVDQFQIRSNRLRRQGYDVDSYYNNYLWENKFKYDEKK